MNVKSETTTPLAGRQKINRRVRILLVVGVLLVATTVAYIQWFVVRPMGRGPAGPTVPAAPFAQTWSDRKIQFVGIGDSVTAGLGADTTDHSYFQRLLKNPADEFEEMRGKSLSVILPNISAENFAISGSASNQHLDVIQERIPTYPEDVYGIVVMTSGGNDLIHWYGRKPPQECAMYGASLEQARPWIDAYRIRLSQMLDTIEAKFPGGCEIYLADIYDPTDGVGDAPSIFLPPWPDGLAIHAEYNQIIRESCQQRDNVFHVPMYEAFLGHGSHCRQFWRPHYDRSDPYYWFHENVEDPNDRGYDAIRRLFLLEFLSRSQFRPASAPATAN
jgi:lysophospholipase L1-like esterase